MKKYRIPKINSVNFAGKWLGLAFLTGAVIPLLIWFVFHVFMWMFCILGGVILAGFIIVFAVEMHQDFGKTAYYQRHLKETIPFDPEKEYAVIRSSVCTGEKVAGFKNREDGHFTEVMLIRNQEEEMKFMEIYNLSSVKKEY